MIHISKFLNNLVANLGALVEPKPAPKAHAQRRSKRGNYDDASVWTKRRLEHVQARRPDLMPKVLSGELTATQAYKITCQSTPPKATHPAPAPPNRFADLCEAWNDATDDERKRFLEYQQGFPQAGDKP